MKITTFATIILVASAPTFIFGQNWSSFQNSGSLEQGELSLPTKWSPDAKPGWQLALKGYGQSSPVIYGDTVFVTSVVGDMKDQVRVLAVNLKDGSEKWSYEQANSTKQKNTVMVSRAAPTPVADSEGVVAFFEGGDIVALDTMGQKRWSRNFREEFGDMKARHGLAASLEQNDSSVFVWVERMQEPFVMAINKSDGKTKWKSVGLGATSWGSPRLVDVGEHQHLVLSGSGVLAGYDPETGERLWEFKEIAGNTSCTPVPVGNGEFLIGASSSRQGQKSAPACGVIQIASSSDAFKASWKWTADRASCSFGSPIAANGKTYFVNRSGILNCHDLESGKKLFDGRLPCSQIWATPLATENVVYFFGKDGQTTILETGDEFKVVQNNKLWEPASTNKDGDDAKQPQFSGAVLYAAAVSNSTLVLRRGDILYAVNAK